MPHVFAFVVLFVGLVVGPLMGQGWVDRTGPNGPAPRYGHAMCYDPVHGYTLMVGVLVTPPAGLLAETWAWNGASWASLGSAPITRGDQYYWPPPSSGAACAMAFHAATNTVVMVAKPNLYTTGSAGQLMGHTWSGSTWSAGASIGLQYPETTGNQQPCQLTMAYDAVRQESVVWCSYNPTRVAIWDGLNWTLRNALVSPAGLPNTGSVCAAWDATVGRIVMSNGNLFYEWTGYAWNQRLPATTLPGLSAAASDAAHQRIVMVDAGGAPQANHTWIANNGMTQQLTTTLEPTPRSASAMAFDSARGVCVLFGGNNGYPMGDTWEFDLGPLASFTPYGTGCVGSRGVPSLIAQGTSTPRLGTTFTAQVNGLPWTGPAFLFVGLSDTSYGGTPLPFDLSILGAPGCSLLTSCEQLHLLTNVLGSAQWSFQVPPVPGASFYTQVFPLDPVNALGLTASNGARGVIGL